jgi:hypothetical protein
MPRIGALLPTAAARVEARRQLASVADVESTDAATLLTRATRGTVNAVITESTDAAGLSVASFVISLAARAPQVPLLIYDRADRIRLAAVRALLIPGLPIDYVVRPVEPLAPVVRDALRAAMPPVVAPVLLQHVVGYAPGPLRVFLTLAACKAPTGRGAAQLAQWGGVSLRTIERRLRRLGWASAHAILQSFRALDVIWLMSEYGWSARRVQLARGLSHPSVITRLTRRWGGGVTPRTIHETGGFDASLSAVLASVMRAPR